MGQIRTQKTNAVVAKADLVTSHHGLNDIHADVLHIAARGDSLAHPKVTASEIGNAFDVPAFHKFDNLADRGLGRNSKWSSHSNRNSLRQSGTRASLS